MERIGQQSKSSKGKNSSKTEGFNDRYFCFVDKDYNCYGTPIPKKRQNWNEFVPNKPYHHISEENNIKYYDPKKWSFYDQHFLYHLYKDDKEYQSLHKDKVKQGLEYFNKNRQSDCHNRIKKENELKAKLFKERLDRIRLGIHKELNPHHSSLEFPNRDSLKDPSRSKAIEIKKSVMMLGYNTSHRLSWPQYFPQSVMAHRFFSFFLFHLKTSPIRGWHSH